jgi:hypothetical protein
MKNRYNSFRLIHKGLRAMLYATSLKIQQADLSSSTEGAVLLAEMQLLLTLFETHAHSEDTYYNAPLEKQKPEIATLFEREHVEDHRLGSELLAIITSWKAATDAQSRFMAGQNLFYAFNEYVAFNLYHMNKEEILLNEALWSAYSDEQIAAFEQEAVQNIPPDKMGEYGKWILRGNNNQDIADWISAIKNGAPAEVYDWILGLAKQELETDRFSAITRSLS